MSDLLFICLDSAALFMLNEQQFYLFGEIQTSQTGTMILPLPMVSVLWLGRSFC